MAVIKPPKETSLAKFVNGGMGVMSGKCSTPDCESFCQVAGTSPTEQTCETAGGCLQQDPGS